MRRSFKEVMALALLTLAAATDPARASAADAVDLFPPQPWVSLLDGGAAGQEAATPGAAASTQGDAALQDPLTDAAGTAEAALTAAPFDAVGEWVEGDQRIIVLAHQGQTYLLCRRCDAAGAVRPGQALAKRYQFLALEASRAVLKDPQGRVIHIDLTPLAPQAR